jgi:DNA-directed RNA polymerase subunit RPC12/RpoP
MRRIYMVPIENQERPNIKSVYTCSNCEKALFDGDDDHPRWNFCPMCGQEIESFGKKKTVMSVAVGLLSATLQVFGMPQATILGWIPATHVGSRSALRPTALAVSEGTIRTASGLI